jgi:hypothetical protein
VDIRYEAYCFAHHEFIQARGPKLWQEYAATLAANCKAVPNESSSTTGSAATAWVSAPWKVSPATRVSATAVTGTGMSGWVPWAREAQRMGGGRR